MWWCIILASLASWPLVAALSHGPVDGCQRVSRRDALVGAAASIVAGSAVLASPQLGNAAEAEMVDLAAFNAARVSGSASRVASIAAGSEKARHTIVPNVDPSPLLPIRGGKGAKSTVQIPRVGYSLYKTAPEQAARCVSLALRSGIRHLDVASLYGSNAEINRPLKLYLDNGFAGLKGYYKEEKPELLELIDAMATAGETHSIETVGLGSKSIAPPIDGSAGRRGRREQLFISHKVSNEEQSTDPVAVRRAVKGAIAELGVGYLDLVSIHSPLTDKGRRLATYQALLDLRDAGFVRSVGVCNYGVGPLKEIEQILGKDNLQNLPAINQLELSPFNAHSDVVRYCDGNGIAVGCAAWSKLSGVDGPSEGWAVLSDLAKAKGVTKAQLLVRWSLQKGYVCVPRSGAASKVERMAIAENSYGGVNPDIPFVLTEEEMRVLDRLDVGYKAGKLGRRDGWGDADVTGPEWDPTELS